MLNLERTLTELDHVRLTKLFHRNRFDGTPQFQSLPIEHVLEWAFVVPAREVSPDVVTMYSQILLKNLDTNERSTLTLCYPAHADADASLVSVLSPVGWSLLGLQVGDIARWTTPRGEEGKAKILAVLFQPESNGNYTM
ncbi:MAG: GreA/GreB family elongation factor [Chromatiales bacterium]|nr:GreA/GreB family elongation factor [Chromatiales bacterium]